jgi:hypothetical protein
LLRYPRHARRRTAVVMMIDCMVITKVNGDSLYGVARHYMEHIVTKGHDVLTIG